MRDLQLTEAKLKKNTDYQNQRVHEIEFASKLMQEIIDEKQGKIEKKQREREEAWKVINDN